MRGVHRLIVLEQLQALGWPGLLGALLWCTTLIVGGALLLPAERERLHTEQRATRAASLAARVARGEQVAPETPAARQAAFYRDFPAPSEITRLVERIYDAAAAAGLSLARGEYALLPVADTRLSRYQISLPLRGDYGRIRDFVGAAQATVPNLVLDDLSLQRQEIGETEVDARIRLSLYLASP